MRGNIFHFISPLKRLLSPWWPRIALEFALSEPLAAICVLKERMADIELKEHIEQYLKNDFPPYFKEPPLLCLSRYIATPNYETLRFINLIEPLNVREVISEDPDDIFVPENDIKRALCKLPICTRITNRNGKRIEHFEKITIVDFQKASGQPLRSIKTLWGESLIDFHHHLLKTLAPHPVTVEQDTEWINRHHRGDLLAHYKEYLTLFIRNGILFEDYIMENKSEATFVKKILLPAIRDVEQRFGHKPLIAPLVPRQVGSATYWISYPPEVRDIIRERMSKI